MSEDKRDPVKTDNDFIIGVSGHAGMVPALPIQIRTRQQAYRTAAWIKAMADVLPDEVIASSYVDIEMAINNT